MKFKKLSYLYILWMFLFIGFPLALIVYYSVTTGSLEEVGKVQFTLKYFYKFFTSKYIRVLFSSIRLAIYSTILCFIVSYPTAYFISQLDAKRKNLLMLLIVVPMWMNFLLRTYAWMTLISNTGIINTLLINLGFSPIKMLYTRGAILMGMVYNFMPFMILPIYSSLEKMDPSYLEASYDLGANKIQTFFKVVFPLSMPGVVSGITMVLIPSISTFEISALLGGNKFNLIGNIIEHQFRVNGNWNYGAAISVVMILMIIVSITVSNVEGS